MVMGKKEDEKRKENNKMAVLKVGEVSLLAQDRGQQGVPKY